MQGFGEFLVQHQILDRFQLFRVLQLQDQIPGARLGACAVALGFARRDAIEQLHSVFEVRGHLDVMHTEPFSREPIEIIRDGSRGPGDPAGATARPG